MLTGNSIDKQDQNLYVYTREREKLRITDHLSSGWWEETDTICYSDKNKSFYNSNTHFNFNFTTEY
jgi:hypothetical protein